jgi:hypothetical protein
MPHTVTMASRRAVFVVPRLLHTLTVTLLLTPFEIRREIHSNISYDRELKEPHILTVVQE